MKKKSKLRLWMQIGFFIIIAAIAITHSLALPYLGKISLRAFCPFGAVHTLYSIITTGFTSPQLRPTVLVPLAIILFLSLLLGPVFCGWICPLGSMQEWIGKLGRNLWGKRYNHLIPERVSYYLSFTRYLALGLVIYVMVRSGNILLSQIDPYHALFNFWTGEVGIVAIIILAVTIIASLFIERPWCKLVCPFGAVLGLFNLIRIIPVRRNKESCVSCHLCSSACPMNIAVENKNCVRDVRCISCLECVSGQTCPQAETVSLSLLPLSKNKKTMKLKAKHVALLILIVLVLGIGTAYVSGYWQSDATKRPAIIQEGEFKGMPDPKDIRGSYSFSDVGKAFDIPVESLLQAFGLEGQDPGRIKLKDLETAYTGSDSKISTSSVRYFVELWTGIYTGGKEATLPPEAEAVLLENGKVVPGK